jgi:RNA recognition motif-containing protein
MATSEVQAGSKRSRSDDTANELEIDLALPEPLSKKEQRKAKKVKTTTTDQTNGTAADSETPSKESKRSEWGVWIGNLPWSVGKQELKDFFCTSDSIAEANITRIHLPAPESKGKPAFKTEQKPKNRGFAYVDFDTTEAQQAALQLSEEILDRRHVLIKQSNNFEGRPAVKAVTEKPAKEEKPPSVKIFVGNFGFEVTQDDVHKHFSQCGEVKTVFLATFEDTGKCKGFGWVTFEDVESSKHAVKGWIPVAAETEDAEEGEASKTKSKPKKKWVNMLHGRLLRCEFAEDQQTRFKKRHGKDKARSANDETGEVRHVAEEHKNTNDSRTLSSHEQRREARKAAKPQQYSKKNDASRQTLPAKATGAIVPPTGKTIFFD